MSTFNRKNFLNRSITSILKQDIVEFEFIIVNNGSFDGSDIICNEFAEKDARIKVIHKKPGTIASGRNAGLDAASGEYIAFVDDDDYVHPDMMSFLHNNIIKFDADLSICGSMREISGKLIPYYVYDNCFIMNTEEAILELLKREKFSNATPTKLWKRKIFENVRFIEDRKYDDANSVYKLISYAERVVAHGLPKYCFCRHDSNISAHVTNDLLLNPTQLEEYLQICRERTVYLTNKLPAISKYIKYAEWSYMISMCNKISKNNLTQCEKQLDFIKKELEINYDEFYKSEYIKDFEKLFMAEYIKNKKLY